MTRREPFPNLRGRRVVLSWLAASVVLFAVLGALDLALRDGGTEGIVAFELAGSTERAREIKQDWGPVGRRTAAVSLIVDFPYLVAYGMFLALASSALGRALAHRRRAARAGIAFAWAGLGAAAADAVEDIALLAVLAGADAQPLPAIAAAFAVAKFALLVSVAAWLVAGTAMWAYGARRRRA